MPASNRRATQGDIRAMLEYLGIQFHRAEDHTPDWPECKHHICVATLMMVRQLAEVADGRE